MKIKKPKELTRREREYLEHLRQAQAQKLTLAQYCRARGLRAQSLYSVSSKLAGKGYVGHRTVEVVAKPLQATNQFVAVRVAPVATMSSGAVCRLRHPSGWMIECMDLPQASWMAALVQGGEHAAT
jgi:hypothetical protein